jgi:hypothetical protein
MNQERVCFVSGHMDLTSEEFAAHYEPAIRAAYAAGARFVVGDAYGCDFMVQRLLAELHTGRPKADGRVRVFHMLERPRHSHGSGYGSHDPNLPKEEWSGPRGGFLLVGGLASDEDRDAAMTAASTDDIAWVRPVKKKRTSGTAKNLARREALRLAARERDRASWPRRVVQDEIGDDGERWLWLLPAGHRDDPGVPMPLDLIVRLDEAKSQLARAEATVQRCFAEVRQLVHEDERAKEGLAP